MTSTTINDRLEERQTEETGHYPGWQAGGRRSVNAGDYTFTVGSYFCSDAGRSAEDAITSTLLTTKRTVARRTR